jgi:hypothetical protein
MVKVIKSQILYIDSQDRPLGQSSSNFSLLIPKGFIEISNQNQKIRITLLDALIPRNFWSITSTNRTFILNINGTLYNINLPLGFWNVNQLATQLKTLLETANGSYNWTILYNQNINYFIFSFTTSGSSNVSFIFSSNDCADFLGFSNNTTNIFIGNILTSVKGINLQGENCIYIRTNISNEIPNIEYSQQGNFSVSNILARIPISVAPFQNIIYQDYSNTYSVISEQNYIDNITITITDRFQSIIDLQTEWSFSLKIEIIETDDIMRLNDNSQNMNDILRLILLQQNEQISK